MRQYLDLALFRESVDRYTYSECGEGFVPLCWSYTRCNGDGMAYFKGNEQCLLGFCDKNYRCSSDICCFTSNDGVDLVERNYFFLKGGASAMKERMFSDRDSLLNAYTELNNSFDHTLIFRMGDGAGFFSEYNCMILAIILIKGILLERKGGMIFFFLSV